MERKVEVAIAILNKKIKGCEDTIKVFRYERDKYQDKFNTFNKFEAASHEYWKAKIMALEDEIADLKDILRILEEEC